MIAIDVCMHPCHLYGIQRKPLTLLTWNVKYGQVIDTEGYDKRAVLTNTQTMQTMPETSIS